MVAQAKKGLPRRRCIGERMEKPSLFHGKALSVILGILVFLGLYLARLYNILLFHSLVETFIVAIAFGVFMVTWNARCATSAGYFTFIGIAFLFVGGVELFHMLSFKEMGIFPGYDINLPIQLSMTTRFILAVSLAAAPRFAGKEINKGFALACYCAATFLLLASIFLGVFPVCFVEGAGLTPFKVYSEYAISTVMLSSVALLLRKKEHFEPDVLRLLVYSTIIAVASNLSFSRFKDPYGFSFLVGHYLAFISYYLIYKAVIGIEIARQYELNRRMQQELADRMQAEKVLHDAQREMQRRQDEVSAFLSGARAVLVHREFQVAARSIFDSCKVLVGAAAGYVALLSPDGANNEVLFLDPGGLPCSVDTSLPMPVRGLRAEAYRSRKAVFCNDFAGSEWNRYMPERHVPLENVLFAPLLIDGEPVGVIGLANKRGGFTEEDARLASAFGELAAVALRNSRTLESLKSSEERFRSVTQTAGDAIISIDRRGTVVLWNPGAERIFGYTDEEMVGQSLSLLIPEHQREAHQEALVRAPETGESGLAEKIIDLVGVRKDGSEFPLELSVASWKAGGEIYFTGIIRDITDRKQAEEEIRTAKDQLEIRVAERTAELRSLAERLQEELNGRRKAEESLYDQAKLLQAVLRSTGDGVVVADQHGKFLLFNPAAEQILGYGEINALPDEWAERYGIYLPDTVTLCPRDQLPMMRAIQGEPVDDEELFIRPGKAAEGVWITCFARPLIGAGMVLKGGVVTFRDITARKVAETALRESEERFRSLVENSPVGIFIVRDGRISFQNQEQKRIFGPMPDSFDLRKFEDIHPEDEAKFKAFCETILSGGSATQETELRFFPYGGRSEGIDMRWVHFRTSPIDYRGEKAVMVNMVDITRLREMEHHVRIKEKMSSLGHVATGIAHEIRNPLSGINIHLSVLEKILDEADFQGPNVVEKARRVMEMMRSASGRIESVVKKVMNFSRPSVPRLDVADINLAIEEAVGFFVVNLGNKGITLDRSALRDLPKCQADPQLISQVLLNLIANAVQALEGVVGPKTIGISSFADAGRAVICISDSGPGIPPPLREKIFDPFYTTRQDGYGIGLSFSRQVITEHGGTLKVNTSRWGGAEFRIELPLKTGRDSA